MGVITTPRALRVLRADTWARGVPRRSWRRGTDELVGLRGGVLIAALGVALSIALHEVGHLVPAKRFGCG